ncbi:MAG TPA: hypothetical protein VGJ27_06520 [Gaiellaceae bacterium]
MDGELMLGMMWQSPKARDLLRDPRCVVHSVVSDRQGTEGDFKLYARALDVPDPARRERHRETIKAPDRLGARGAGLPPVRLDVDSAGLVVFGDDRYGLAWDPERGLRRWSQRES